MPIFHLSFPVRDLDEAIDFYRRTFGARVGRREETWADIALFDAQVTLQCAPGDVTAAMPRTRHFGATLHWEQWQGLANSAAAFVEPPALRFEGTDREQGKCMLADPSGNLIEIKAYRNPAAVLGSLAAGLAE